MQWSILEFRCKNFILFLLLCNFANLKSTKKVAKLNGFTVCSYPSIYRGFMYLVQKQYKTTSMIKTFGVSVNFMMINMFSAFLWMSESVFYYPVIAPGDTKTSIKLEQNGSFVVEVLRHVCNKYHRKRGLVMWWLNVRRISLEYLF